MTRLSWDQYFLLIADTVAERADCSRAQHGTVIVKDNRIVSTGYNGSPSGGLSCLDGECPRGSLSEKAVPHLSGDYDGCISIHSEANAIAYANHSDTDGATIYVTGEPCIGCWKLIQAAGIYRICYWKDGYPYSVLSSSMQWPYDNEHRIVSKAPVWPSSGIETASGTTNGNIYR